MKNFEKVKEKAHKMMTKGSSDNEQHNNSFFSFDSTNAEH